MLRKKSDIQKLSRFTMIFKMWTNEGCREMRLKPVLYYLSHFRNATKVLQLHASKIIISKFIPEDCCGHFIIYDITQNGK